MDNWSDAITTYPPEKNFPFFLLNPFLTQSHTIPPPGTQSPVRLNPSWRPIPDAKLERETNTGITIHYLHYWHHLLLLSILKYLRNIFIIFQSCSNTLTFRKNKSKTNTKASNFVNSTI